MKFRGNKGRSKCNLATRKTPEKKSVILSLSKDQTRFLFPTDKTVLSGLKRELPAFSVLPDESDPSTSSG